MTLGHKDVTVTVVIYIPFEGMKFYLLIFSFLRLAPTQIPGVEFHQSTRKASAKIAESGERSVLALGSLCLRPCPAAGYSVKLIYLISFIIC